MKTILLWDPRFPDRKPTRLMLDDALASACVRAGVAAAADPSEQGALATGAPIDPGSLVEVIVQHGPPQRITRVVMPAAVVAVGAALGICAPVGGGSVGGGGGGPPDTLTLVGALPPAAANQFYDATLAVSGGLATSLSNIAVPAWMSVAIVNGGAGIRFYGTAPETLA